MNKLLTLVLLVAPLFGAGTKFGDGPIPPSLIYANLGTASAKTGYIYRVTDCLSLACTVGGGSIQAMLFSNGTTWQVMGTSATGSGCIPAGISGQVLTDDGAGGCVAITTTGSGSGVKATSPSIVTPFLTAPALGTPASGVATNLTGLPLTTGVTGTLAVANGGTGVTTSTGTGSTVRNTSPTLVTPVLGVPSSVTLTNGTGLPISTGVSGLGTGIATFLATPTSSNLIAAVTDETGSGALVFATSPTLVTPALGTPSSVTLTNGTGLPISSGVSGLGTGVATALATPSSANILAMVTDETGTGLLVFGTSPTIVTPTIASFTNAAHNHTNAAGGAQLTDAALSAAVTVPKGGCGTTTHTAYALIAGGTTSTGTCQSLASVGTSGQVLTSNGAGLLPTWQAAGGSGSPGGSTTQLQYNNAGSFGGVSSWTTNGTTSLTGDASAILDCTNCSSVIIPAPYVKTTVTNTYTAGATQIFTPSATLGGLQLVGAARPSAPTGGVLNIDLSGRFAFYTGSAWVGAFFPETPASAAATCTTNQLAFDSSYLYVCTGTNAWKRVAISTW